jgi:hypothetical protein
MKEVPFFKASDWRRKPQAVSSLAACECNPWSAVWFSKCRPVPAGNAGNGWNRVEAYKSSRFLNAGMSHLKIGYQVLPTRKRATVIPLLTVHSSRLLTSSHSRRLPTTRKPIMAPETSPTTGPTNAIMVIGTLIAAAIAASRAVSPPLSLRSTTKRKADEDDPGCSMEGMVHVRVEIAGPDMLIHPKFRK